MRSAPFNKSLSINQTASDAPRKTGVGRSHLGDLFGVTGDLKPAARSAIDLFSGCAFPPEMMAVGVAAAQRARSSSDEGGDGLGHGVFGDVLRPICSSVPPITYRWLLVHFGQRVVSRHLQHIIEFRADDQVTADADGEVLPGRCRGQGIDDLVG